jgi:response regulator RpfG family c-di-GMP phosphodiesterase
MANATDATILIVDDSSDNLSVLHGVLSPEFRVLAAMNGATALRIAQAQPKPDLILLDVMMPGMDGYAVLAQLRCDPRTQDIAVIFLTALDSPENEEHGLQLGAVDYITKPITPLLVLARVRTQLLAKEARDNQAQRSVQLEALVKTRTAALKLAHDQLLAANEKLKTNFITSIKVFSNLIELRVGSQPGHSRRVADLARRIALQMNLDAKTTQEVFVAGLLHAIGKVGLDDVLVNMPVASMSSEQLSTFRRHVVRAEQLLLPLQDLRTITAIICAQLERFDGDGYPAGLVGRDIPMGARILALACDYIDLQSATASPTAAYVRGAQESITRGSGKRYDPDVVRAFLATFGMMPESKNAQAPCAKSVAVRELEVGMVLAHDLITPSGMLMLSAGHELDEHLIKKILEFQGSAGLSISADILPTQEP